MQHPDLVQFDPEQYQGVWKVLRTHATVASCMQCLHNFVLGRGLNITGLSLDTASMSAIENAYMAASHSALEWVLTVGVVPVTFKKLHSLDILLPIVPAPESITLFVRVTQTGEKVFEACLKKDFNLMNRFTGSIQSNSEGASNAKIVVWGGTHYTPTSTGEIVTPITHLQSSEEFINFLKQRALVAEHIKSNPPIVSQNRKQTNTDMEGIAFGVDENTIKHVEEETMRRKEEISNKQLLMHSEWTCNVVPRGEGDTAAFLESVAPHEYFVSHNRDPTRVEKAESVDRLPELLRWSEEKIYQIFGLPFSMFSNSGGPNPSGVSEHFK